MSMDVQIILMTIIAFSAVVSVLGLIFSWLLSPVIKNQEKMGADLKKTKENQDQQQKTISTLLIVLGNKQHEGPITKSNVQGDNSD